jgi:gliding motility-associated protein GldM
MAGGKETPRQKMIGMMYLVLTALLALNVSKQVIAAFITLNDKVEVSTSAIESKVDGIYQGFDNKITTLKATGGDVKLIKEWQSKALEIKEEAAKTIQFLIENSNKMIKTAEGKDWIDHSKDVEVNGKKYATELHSLHEIANFDNYDIPTNIFITADGGTAHKPNKTGEAIRTTLIAYRNSLCEKMANYTKGKKKYSFKAPADKKGLKAAFATANPEDTARISQIYNILGYPEKVLNHDHEEVAWVASLFDHAPIVAAAAMFAALRSDVRNAEAIASEHMLDKVEVQMFNFNKIEPLAFASKGYINQGDSINLNVMIAAYDSTEENKIRYGIDADTANPETWKEIVGTIGLKGDKPGPHKVKGQIFIKQKGELVAKPWEFTYSVGAPMGVVAQPEMRILYWGYNNVVEGTASGFPADKVKLSGSGCSLSGKGKGQYIAKVGRGTRKAKINVSGIKDDGSSVSLGSFEFECRPMPPATVYFGKTQMGGTASYQAAKGQSGIRVGYDPSVPLKDVKFTIKSGQVKVDGVPGTGKVLASGRFDSKAKSILRQSKGKIVTIVVDYKGPDGIGKKGGITFKVR